MKVIAPGKVLLFGAYAVLEGAPALVAAVDRYAVADTERLEPSPFREVRAAIGDAPAPAVDVSALHDASGAKLGLGSSAAALVAVLAARAAMGGDDLSRDEVRTAIASQARRAHAEAQGGGSGVDIAASTFGGSLVYSMGERSVEPVSLPGKVSLNVFWSGTSARTSDLRAAVSRLSEKDVASYRASIDALATCSTRAIAACRNGDLRGLIEAGQANSRALADLGRASDSPIVPAAFSDLAPHAEGEGAAFFPSGAGGGDVALWLGVDPPSNAVKTRARSLGMFLLDLGMDRAGVRIRKD